MSEATKKIYRLSEKYYFRVCEYEDCSERVSHWKGHEMCIADPFSMAQEPHEGGIHLHCPIHTEFEMVTTQNNVGPRSYGLSCAACGNIQQVGRMLLSEIDTIKRQARAALNSSMFKGAKLIRLDDFYTPELSVKSTATKNSKYWMSYDVKESKDGSPLLILYLGDRQENTKAQFFIDPETKKLSHDQKDTEPIAVVSRIEVQFKDGVIELKDKTK